MVTYQVDVSLSHVSFSYGRKQALSDVSLSFGNGVFGLLGPNGAGKTTLMNIVTTLSRPSSGSVRIAGANVLTNSGRRRARSRIGYLPQSFELMNASSLLRNVRYAAWARGLSWKASCDAAVWALEQVELSGEARRPVRSLSGGMRQRAGIACAIVARPDVLVLDEPTVGLDPVQRIEVRKFLDAYADSHTVLVSTHLVEDLAAIADRVLVLDHGRLLLDGRMDDLAALADSEDSMASPWESGYRRLLTGSEHLPSDQGEVS